jgi:hypothetical protein
VNTLDFETWWAEYINKSPKKDELMKGSVKEACRMAWFVSKL